MLESLTMVPFFLPTIQSPPAIIDVRWVRHQHHYHHHHYYWPHHAHDRMEWARRYAMEQDAREARERHRLEEREAAIERRDAQELPAKQLAAMEDLARWTEERVEEMNTLVPPSPANPFGALAPITVQSLPIMVSVTWAPLMNGAAPILQSRGF